ncbi:hypothetical protein [Rhizobium sp. S96]|uniref:hypothetical protein n=1 Tax=Rhizobium sp. S96 TaxID=3055140 RepID=UPI0025AA3434|nr:hypothetical protein [Rhizobium sp. S96]MDM9619061.1 hypothetical protein [Rhizobium sp. S96]
MTKPSAFSVKINGGPEQEIVCRTGLYHRAAAAAVAMLDYPEKTGQWDVVEIWVPQLQPDYPPSFYAMESDIYGNMIVKHLPGSGRSIVT